MDLIINSVYEGLKFTSDDLMKYETMQTKIQEIKRKMGNKYIFHPDYKRKPIWM